MNWQLRIPHYGNPDDPVSEIGSAARGFPEDERAVVQALTLTAIEAGYETVGEFFDRLEEIGPASCRKLFDLARQEVGL